MRAAGGKFADISAATVKRSHEVILAEEENTQKGNKDMSRGGETWKRFIERMSRPSWVAVMVGVMSKPGQGSRFWLELEATATERREAA